LQAHNYAVISLTKERKSQRLVARVSKTHKKLFQRAAALEGRTVATFVIAHALEAAEQLIGKRETIRLNAEQSRRFAEVLLAPPRAVPSALRKAHSEYRKRVVKT